MENVMTFRNAARVTSGTVALVVLLLTSVFVIGAFEPGVSAWTTIARVLIASVGLLLFVVLSVFALREPRPRRLRSDLDTIMYSDRL